MMVCYDLPESDTAKLSTVEVRLTRSWHQLHCVALSALLGAGCASTLRRDARPMHPCGTDCVTVLADCELRCKRSTYT